jgi:5-methylcytosine-specific restriction endonuclease McrA
VCVIVGCLALNASFEPLTMVPVKRALRLVIDGKAEIVECDPARMVHSARMTMPRPAVIRLTRFIHVPRRFRRQVTNTFLFARDRYRCQYCGRTQGELRLREALTRDHVIPLSRGGTNEWTNVVTACSTCNLRKSNHYAHEIGMHLLTVPVEPHFVHLSWAVRRLTPTQAKYIRIFYGGQMLQQLEQLEAHTAALPSPSAVPSPSAPAPRVADVAVAPAAPPLARRRQGRKVSERTS